MANQFPITPGSGDTVVGVDISTFTAYPTTGKLPAGVVYVSQTSGVAPAPLTAANPMPVGISAGTAIIGSVKFADALDPTNDGVRARIVSGLLDDGAGNSLTIKTANGTASASGVNAAVAAVTGKRIRVLSYSLQAANANGSAVAANWQDDAGTPIVLSQTWDLAAREGVSKAPSPGQFYFQTTSGQALKLNLGSALSVRWEITYVEV